MPLPIWIRSRRSPFRKRPSPEFEKARQLGRQLGALKLVQSALERSAGVVVPTEQSRHPPAGHALALQSGELTSTSLRLRSLMMESSRLLKSLRPGETPHPIPAGMIKTITLDACSIASELRRVRDTLAREKGQQERARQALRTVRGKLPEASELDVIIQELEKLERHA